MDDHRRNLVVDDPEQANVFIIDHDWVSVSRKHCSLAIEKHLTPIINNVIYNYPFFNRSFGRDHFFFAVYDNGAFCSLQPCEERRDRSILYKIFNVSQIGNQGMDRDTYYESPDSSVLKSVWNSKLPFNIPCHRSEKDIVIPQLMQLGIRYFKNNTSRFPYRIYDSSFSGAMWSRAWGRKPLKYMEDTEFSDYQYNKTERFLSSLIKLETTYPFKSYFMYNPCGFACWSQRLYEALSDYTIPILIMDGGIQPFEKFLNWSKFTVKISESTWFNESSRNDYRRMIRRESDKFRQSVTACYRYMNIQLPNASIDYIPHRDPVQSLFNETWVKYVENDEKNVCRDIFDTFIWKKTTAIKRVIPWLDFSDSKKSINAFRLLTLEIYCKSSVKSLSLVSDITLHLCNRSPDNSSRLEYFY